MENCGRPALLVDVLGTLVHDPFYVEVPRALGMTLQELLRVKHPTAWVEFELGRLTEEEFLPRFFADGRDFDRAALVGSFARSFRFLEGIEPLLEELCEAGVRPHVLSNYPIWYRRIEEQVRLSRFAEWSFVSCHTRLRKPDPQAFLHAAHALGRDPTDCVFVDDVERNVAAAARVGMVALRFTGAAALRQELSSLGLLRDRGSPRAGGTSA
jgi:HAD superfamily hydrolase (TIGR01509 family)